MLDIYVCCVRAGQKWKITGAIKLERTDCQTEGKQVFEAIIVTLGCVLTIMWHHIFLSPVPPLLYLTRTSSSALLLAAFHARIDNDSSNTLDWILILEQWVECSFLRVDPGNTGMSGRVRRSWGISGIELIRIHLIYRYQNIMFSKCKVVSLDIYLCTYCICRGISTETQIQSGEDLRSGM